MSEGRRLHADPPLPFDEAVSRVREAVTPLAIERVDLARAQGRLLAETITASHPIPPFPNSMVDGFAVQARDVRDASVEMPVELQIVGESLAGAGATHELTSGEAIRTMTGAPVPPGADAVVMLERTVWTDTRVRVEAPVESGRAIRAAGEDMTEGETVFEPGVEIGPPELGVLASLGCARPAVRRRPRVAVLATGDELLGVDDALRPGMIRSSNDWTLIGQVREAGGEPIALGRVGDEDDALGAALRRGRDADVLLTSGGVSVGDRDRVQDVLAELGFEKLFWRVLSSPGKPLLFGRLGETLFFGLPGNPVSSMVAFESFVRPTLRRLQGDPFPERRRVRARVADTLKGPEDRRHFARVTLVDTGHGYLVREVRPHGSGNLRSMVRANALAIVPEGVRRVCEGDVVDVVVLREPRAGGAEEK